MWFAFRTAPGTSHVLRAAFGTFCYKTEMQNENRLFSSALSDCHKRTVRYNVVPGTRRLVFLSSSTVLAVRAIVVCVEIGLPSSKWLTEGGL